MNGFAELPATLASGTGCHVGIQFKRVGFELYIYMYIYIHTHIYLISEMLFSLAKNMRNYYINCVKVQLQKSIINLI